MPDWNRIVKQDKYVSVYFPDHPQARANGYISVHRLVMEAILDRPLRSDEIVHHKNENTRDNNPYNLEAMTRAEHALHHHPPTGRTMVDLICPCCGIEFERERRQTHLVKPQEQTFCSRECIGGYKK